MVGRVISNLLEFDYKAEVKIDTWEGISGYHDFELHENGDITAWRSYQVDKGKRFARQPLMRSTNMVANSALHRRYSLSQKSNQDFQPEKSSRRKRQLKVDSGTDSHKKEG
jgi:hypothetical protein